MNPDFWSQIGAMGQFWDSFGTVVFLVRFCVPATFVG